MNLLPAVRGAITKDLVKRMAERTEHGGLVGRRFVFPQIHEFPVRIGEWNTLRESLGPFYVICAIAPPKRIFAFWVDDLLSTANACIPQNSVPDLQPRTPKPIAANTMNTSKSRNSSHSLLGMARLVFCLVLVTGSASLAADRTWTAGAGTTVINTPNNWSDNTAPTAAGDLAIWDGTVQTNSIYVWNAAFGPTSGNAGAPSLLVRSGYTNDSVLMNSGAGGNLSFSNIVIEAGAGPFQLGSNGIVSGTVFRGTVNYTVSPVTKATDVFGIGCSDSRAGFGA